MKVVIGSESVHSFQYLAILNEYFYINNYSLKLILRLLYGFKFQSLIGHLKVMVSRCAGRWGHQMW